MKKEYGVVLTTCACKEDAKPIINELLEKKLAACIQMFPICSFYSWKGEICNDDEVCLLIKCNLDSYNEIEQIIKLNHKYELPEIIALPIKTGIDGYLKWIDDVTLHNN